MSGFGHVLEFFLRWADLTSLENFDQELWDGTRLVEGMEKRKTAYHLIEFGSPLNHVCDLGFEIFWVGMRSKFREWGINLAESNMRSCSKWPLVEDTITRRQTWSIETKFVMFQIRKFPWTSVMFRGRSHVSANSPAVLVNGTEWLG